MRQLTVEETTAVGGAADCSDLTLSITRVGPTISGSFDAWYGCAVQLSHSIGDAVYGQWSHFTLGIPYGSAHVA
jgi:hypothetical protein